MSESVKGVVGVLIAPGGAVWAHAADFEAQGYGGFTLAAAQKIRVKRALAFALVRSAVAEPVLEGLRDHDCERLVDELLRKGWKRELIEIGHGEAGS